MEPSVQAPTTKTPEKFYSLVAELKDLFKELGRKAKNTGIVDLNERIPLQELQMAKGGKGGDEMTPMERNMHSLINGLNSIEQRLERIDKNTFEVGNQVQSAFSQIRSTRDFVKTLREKTLIYLVRSLQAVVSSPTGQAGCQPHLSATDQSG